MISNNNLVGFVKTIFPNGKVNLRQEPSKNSPTLAIAKSDDKVTILNTYSTWYYVAHEKSGLKGWVSRHQLFILNEPDPEQLAKLRSTGNSQSFQAFNYSQSLVFSPQLIQEYFSY